MWFKNLQLFRLDHWPAPGDAALADALTAHALKPCGKLEPASQGWVSPYGRGDERLAHTANGCHLLRYGLQERVLPGAVVRDKVTERMEAFRERTGNRPTRRQQVSLRDEVMVELLPQAFVKPAHTDCYIDPKGGWLVVDAGSAKRAEDVATLLRQSVDGTRLQALDVSNKVKTMLTLWLDAGRCGDEFDFGDECDLRDDRDEGATVRCRKQDLETAEVRQHLAAGKQVIKLGLVWAERLRFALGEDFSLARLRPEEIMIEQMEALPDDDDLAAMDAEFVMMTLEFRALLEALIKALELKIE